VKIETLQDFFSRASSTLIVLQAMQVVKLGREVVAGRKFGLKCCTTAPPAPPVIQDRMRERTVELERIKQLCTTVRVQKCKQSPQLSFSGQSKVASQ
jgi:hypothetical protein